MEGIDKMYIFILDSFALLLHASSRYNSFLHFLLNPLFNSVFSGKTKKFTYINILSYLESTFLKVNLVNRNGAVSIRLLGAKRNGCFPDSRFTRFCGMFLIF